MPSETASEDWREIERLVDDLSQLAAQQPDPPTFYQQLLPNSIHLLAADGGAVWLFDEQGRLQLEYQVNLQGLGLTEATAEEAHNRLLKRSLAERQVLFVPAHASGRAQDLQNPTPYLLGFCPIMLDQRLLGALEIFQGRRLSPAALRGASQLLTAVTEVASEYHRGRDDRRLRADAEFQAEVAHFALRIGRSLDERNTAYEIANEMRRILHCDRVSVAAGNAPRRIRLLAVSGVDNLDSRANSVRRMQELANFVAASGETVWRRGAAEVSPPEASELVDRYLDQTHVRQLAVLPLVEAPMQETEGAQQTMIKGAVILECFADSWDEEVLRRASQLIPHAANALHLAHEHQSLPLLSLSRRLRTITWLFGPDGWPRTTAVAAIVIALLLAVTLIPGELRLEARGRLEPLARARIYAPHDGVVESSLAHEAAVEQGATLATLSSSSLSLEKERVQTRIDTTRSRLDSISIVMLEGPPNSRDESQWRANLSAEREELEKLLESLETQSLLLDRELEELTLLSPLTGFVLTWDVENLLRRRPVRRGQLLMTVADMNGPWILELEVPDYYIGHVLKARAERQDGETPLTFVLGTAPGSVYRGRILHIASSTTTDDQQRRVVEIRGSVDQPIQSGMRPGATVMASIHCSRAPLIYVWLHDVIDVVRTKLWW